MILLDIHVKWVEILATPGPLIHKCPMTVHKPERADGDRRVNLAWQANLDGMIYPNFIQVWWSCSLL